jgi:hypothetical protein
LLHKKKQGLGWLTVDAAFPAAPAIFRFTSFVIRAAFQSDGAEEQRAV